MTAPRLSPLDAFHPWIGTWFRARFPSPTEVQQCAWPSILEGRDVLVVAPTGSGKTMTGFLGALNRLVLRRLDTLTPETQKKTSILYISPLKALSADIEKNLTGPLAELRAVAKRDGAELTIGIGLRTGDTDPKTRRKQTQSPPDVLVSTPESLYVLLTSEGGRGLLSGVETVIVDEIHAVLRDKRGAHLALSLERLDQLVTEAGGSPPQRIGLSATQRPVDLVAKFLVGARPNPVVVDGGHVRPWDLKLELPDIPLSAVLGNDAWGRIYDSIATHVQEHRTTLVFANTRRQAERATYQLSERLGKGAVMSHHGSLAKELRLEAEQALKAGRLRALVATASMELGIDVGEVDLVCQLGTPRSISAFLQRVGRSGHSVTGTPRGRLYPLSRNDLVECTALLDAVSRGELDLLRERTAPLDILAQQVTAEVAARSSTVDELFAWVQRAAPYRELEERQFLQVLEMLANGYVGARGPRGAHIHWDRVTHRVVARRGARLAALTSGGAIPENFEYEVLLEPSAQRIGSLNEDFAIESSIGDIFQLGNRSYQIVKLDPGVIRVTDAGNSVPNLPFWLGEAPSRTAELSAAVARVRKLKDTSGGASARKLFPHLSLDDRAVEDLDTYLDASRTALGFLPTQERLVAERFFDETGGMHVVIHSPFGARLNRAFGLALRKRFCRTFNVELQAAADDDALLLSLGPMHSFPLEELPRFLRSGSAAPVLSQAVLDAPLFGTRFRQNATFALSILRFRGGKKVAPRFQRMEADDLLAHCFPDQVACLENIVGSRSIPDHPLVTQTLRDCLEDAMDERGLLEVLRAIESGAIDFVVQEATEPSPLSEEILNSRPYAFLDDAPLEERRSQAVRRFTRLDEVTPIALSPEKLRPGIEQVLREIALDLRSPEELQERAFVHGYLTFEEIERAGARAEFDLATADGRLGQLGPASQGLWTSRDHLPKLSAAFEGSDEDARASAVRELLRGRLGLVGPISVAELERENGLPAELLETGLRELEAAGTILGGRFRGADPEYCDRRLLRRIYDSVKRRERSSVAPVSIEGYLRFLSDFQGISRKERRRGEGGLLRTLAQLTGYSAPLSEWESSILSARVEGFVPSELDLLGWSGRITWGAVGRRGPGPLANLPITFCNRGEGQHLLGEVLRAKPLGADEARVERILLSRGALFVEELRVASGLLPSALEEALKSLVSRGLVNFDSLAPLRNLRRPGKRTRPGSRARTPARASGGGRVEWLGPRASLETATEEQEAVEFHARSFLARYGLVSRALLQREPNAPPLRALLPVLYRLEARGEVRAGRFVAGIYGEQFALPEVVATLESYRHAPLTTEYVTVNASDPMNVLGALLGDDAIPRDARVLLDHGTPVAYRHENRLILIPGRKIEEEVARQELFPSGLAHKKGTRDRKVAAEIPL